MDRGLYPILEFDTNKTAKLNPSDLGVSKLSASKLIITFFKEVIDELEFHSEIVVERVITGENPFYVYRFVKEPDILIILGQVGCPACGSNLDCLNSMGVNKVMFCGGGGVLDSNIDVGELLLVSGAIRDEGFSYHYIEPSRVIYTNERVRSVIRDYLVKNDINYLEGLTWTTDAIWRETSDRIALRKSEGAKIVEMEQAGCIAVAEFRGFDYGALLYGGDDVSGEVWSNRTWKSRLGIRYDLVMLCKKLVDLI